MKASLGLAFASAFALIAAACAPKAEAPEPQSINILVDPDGKVFLNGKQVTESELNAVLADLQMLKADGAAPK